MALREFSRKLRIPDRGSKINLQYSFENTVRRVEISADSSTLLQKRILLPETRAIQLRATGGGIGLVQVIIKFLFNVSMLASSVIGKTDRGKLPTYLLVCALGISE